MNSFLNFPNFNEMNKMGDDGYNTISTAVKDIEAVPKPNRIRYGWDVMYSALLKYGETNGNYNVPRRYVCDLPFDSANNNSKLAEKGNLGSWLTTQRVEKANGRLKPERLALLQALSDQGKFDWSPTNHFKQSETSWPYMYRCLVNYCDSQPDGVEVSSIPERKRWIHPESNIDVGLGRWMHTQNKRRRIGKLRPDRLAMLQELVDAGKFRWPQIRQKSDKKSNNLSSNTNTNGTKHSLPKFRNNNSSENTVSNRPVGFRMQTGLPISTNLNGLGFTSDYDSDNSDNILTHPFEGVGVNYNFQHNHQIYNSTNKDSTDNKHATLQEMAYFGDNSVNPSRFDVHFIQSEMPVGVLFNSGLVKNVSIPANNAVYNTYLPSEETQHLLNVFNESESYHGGKRLREDSENFNLYNS